MKTLLTILFLFLTYSSFSQGIPDVIENDSTSSIGFVTNAGQILNSDTLSMPSIYYHSIHSIPQSYFFDNKMAFVYANFVKDSGDTIIAQKIRRLDIGWIGEAASQVQPVAFGETSEKVNYYYPHCNNDCDSLSKYKGLLYENIYPGIDLRVFSNRAGLKFYFVIKPSSDPDEITLNFIGQDVRIITPNLLCLTLGTDTFLLTNPTTYEYNNSGVTTSLSWSPIFIDNGGYVNINSNSGVYNNSSTLVYEYSAVEYIQTVSNPKNLSWSTLMGGDIWTQFWDLDIDVDGSVYVNGYSTCTNFPSSHSLIYYNSGPKGNKFALNTADVITLKFDHDNILKWSTYFGGYNDDGYVWYGISVDALDNVYINPSSRSSYLPLLPFPTYVPWPEGNNESGYYDETNLGYGGTEGLDQVIIKFDKNTGVRKWATFFGGESSADLSYVESDIIVDKQDNGFYISGHDRDIFVTNEAGPYIYYDNDLQQSAFLAKFNSDFVCTWSTYISKNYGTSTNGEGTTIGSLDLDDESRLIVTGRAGHASNPNGDITLPLVHSGTQYHQTYAFDEYFNEPHNGGYNFNNFIMRFNTDLSINWSTYLGGSNSIDQFKFSATKPNVHATNNGKIFIATVTRTQQNALVPYPLLASSNTNAYFKDDYVDSWLANNTTAHWWSEGAITQFNSDCEMEYSTYIGGEDGDWPYSVTSDEIGNIYVSGWTASNNYPIENGTFPFPAEPYEDYYLDIYSGRQPIGGGSGWEDGFIAGFTPDMVHKWTNFVGTFEHDYITSSKCFEDYYYVVGSTSNAYKFPLRISDNNIGNAYFSSFNKKTFPSPYDPHTDPDDPGLGFDGFIQRYKLTGFSMGTKEISNKKEVNKLIVYPNPSTHNLNIMVKGKYISSIEVYDVLGKLVLNSKSKNNSIKNEIDISNFVNGIYHINAYTLEGNRLTSTFLKN